MALWAFIAQQDYTAHTMNCKNRGNEMIKDNLLNKIFMSIVLISGGALSAVGMMAIMVCLVNPQMLRYDFIMPLTYTCFPLFTLIFLYCVCIRKNDTIWH